MERLTGTIRLVDHGLNDPTPGVDEPTEKKQKTRKCRKPIIYELQGCIEEENKTETRAGRQLIISAGILIEPDTQTDRHADSHCLSTRTIENISENQPSEPSSKRIKRIYIYL